MYTDTDAIRSLQRYLASVLDTIPQVVDGSPVLWDVQRARREPTDRPGAVVRALPIQTTEGTAYTVHVTQPFEVFIWPVGIEGDAVGSEHEAQLIRTVIRRAISAGFLPSRALRVAAFDYDGLAHDEPLPNDAESYGFFLVSRNYTTQVRVDPDVDDLYTVFLGLSLSWTEQGDTSRFDGPPLAGWEIGGTGEQIDELPG